MKITDIRIRKTSTEGKMRAVVSVTFDDAFVVHDIKIIDGNEKMFVAAPEYETDVVVQEETEACPDGAAPDADGCCTGEELVEMSDGALMCCGMDECFPPML